MKGKLDEHLHFSATYDSDDGDDDRGDSDDDSDGDGDGDDDSDVDSDDSNDGDDNCILSTITVSECKNVDLGDMIIM